MKAMQLLFKGEKYISIYSYMDIYVYIIYMHIYINTYICTHISHINILLKYIILQYKIVEVEWLLGMVEPLTVEGNFKEQGYAVASLTGG